MADKELRRMSRSELIEIIYALQQDERSLREENEDLRRQLDDRTLRLNQAGSMAEAALSLNRVFEDADAAARQYVESLRAADARASETLEAARREAEAIVADAREGARRAERGEAANEAIRQAVRKRAMLARDAKRAPEEGEGAGPLARRGPGVHAKRCAGGGGPDG